jgi:hypothetical protein
MPTKTELVNHPPHYNEHPSKVECIELKRELVSDIGDAFKYIWRRSLKDSETQDLDKAIWYILDDREHQIPRIELSGLAQHHLATIIKAEPNLKIATIFQLLVIISTTIVDYSMYDLVVNLIKSLTDKQPDRSKVILDESIDHCDLDNL